MTKPVEYSSLHDEDENSQCQQCQTRKTESRWPRLPLPAVIVLGALLTLTLLSSILALASPRKPGHRILPYVRPGVDKDSGLPIHWYNGDCGNSPEEAEARGCFYNYAVHVWLPPGCFTDEDRTDSEEMYRDKEGWFYEANGKNLTLEEVSRGHYHHFSCTWETHMAHCAYTWKRLHRALTNPDMKIDAYTINYYHSEHCVALLSGQHSDEIGHNPNMLFSKFPDCG